MKRSACSVRKEANERERSIRVQNTHNTLSSVNIYLFYFIGRNVFPSNITRAEKAALEMSGLTRKERDYYNAATLSKEPAILVKYNLRVYLQTEFTLQLTARHSFLMFNKGARCNATMARLRHLMPERIIADPLSLC